MTQQGRMDEERMKFIDTIPSTNCAEWECTVCGTSWVSPRRPTCTVCVEREALRDAVVAAAVAWAEAQETFEVLNEEGPGAPGWRRAYEAVDRAEEDLRAAVGRMRGEAEGG